MIDDITNRSLDETRAAHKKYLCAQNLSQNTTATSSTDAFYIWRKQGHEVFWKIVTSYDFEALRKAMSAAMLMQQLYIS